MENWHEINKKMLPDENLEAWLRNQHLIVTPENVEALKDLLMTALEHGQRQQEGVYPHPVKSYDDSGFWHYPLIGKCGSIRGCRLSVCDKCMLGAKMCGFCQGYIAEGDTERFYDGDYPMHDKCYKEAFE